MGENMRQAGVVPQIGGRQAGAFEKKTGDENYTEQGEDNVVVPDDLQPFGLEGKTPDNESGQHQNRYDAGRIQRQLESLVECS